MNTVTTIKNINIPKLGWVLLFLASIMLVRPALAKEEAGVTVDDAVFYELPQMIINLQTGGHAVRMLKVTLNLELDNAEDIDAIERLKPRVMNEFQIYLRRMKMVDFNGSTNLYRIKNALLEKANESAKPVKVKNVLFKQILVQ